MNGVLRIYHVRYAGRICPIKVCCSLEIILTLVMILRDGWSTPLIILIKRIKKILMLKGLKGRRIPGGKLGDLLMLVLGIKIYE